MRSSLVAGMLLALFALLSVPAAVARPAGESTVPPLYGLTRARAAARVHAVGLKLSSDGNGKVVEQNPVPGSHAAKGATVHVTLHPPGH